MMNQQGSYVFWLLGLPGQQKAERLDKLRNKTNYLCALFEFNIPHLRYGSLDHLITASTEIEKLEKDVTGHISRKIHTLRDVLKMGPEILKQCTQVEGRPMPQYLHKFNWNKERFPRCLGIAELQQQVLKQVEVGGTEMTKHLEEYAEVKKKLEAAERAQRGPLVSRSIARLVKKDDFVLDSENLRTAVVVVPRELVHEWNTNYELLNDEVVPRSSKLLYQEGNCCLYSVVIFKRRFQEFAKKARQMRFFVRDFVYDEQTVQLEISSHIQLRQEKILLEKPLTRLFKTGFSIMYSSLAHVYAMKLFVECVLRFGLPVNYLYLFAVVARLHEKKLKKIFKKHFAFLDKTPCQKEKEKEALGEQFYPFVVFTLRADPSDF